MFCLTAMPEVRWTGNLDEAIDRVLAEIQQLREELVTSPIGELEERWRERRAALAYLLVLKKKWIGAN